jgi:hypothetical protein
MRWPWRQQARPVEPRPMISIRAMELETAKEILAEVFGARCLHLIHDYFIFI